MDTLQFVAILVTGFAINDFVLYYMYKTTAEKALRDLQTMLAGSAVVLAEDRIKDVQSSETVH